MILASPRCVTASAVVSITAGFMLYIGRTWAGRLANWSAVFSLRRWLCYEFHSGSSIPSCATKRTHAWAEEWDVSTPLATFCGGDPGAVRTRPCGKEPRLAFGTRGNFCRFLHAVGLHDRLRRRDAECDLFRRYHRRTRGLGHHGIATRMGCGCGQFARNASARAMFLAVAHVGISNVPVSAGVLARVFSAIRCAVASSNATSAGPVGTGTFRLAVRFTHWNRAFHASATSARQLAEHPAWPRK